MKRVPWLMPLAFCLSSGVWAACEPGVEPLAAPQMQTGKARPHGELRSVVLTPPAGTELRSDSVLTVDLEYFIADFSPGLFKLMPMFKSGHTGSRGVEVDGKDLILRLELASGRVRLCVPLASLYTEPESVYWPLELSLSLLQEEPGGGSVRVAWQRPIKLNVIDAPAAALARQAQAPPAEYDDALEFVHEHFQRRSMLYKACLQRFQPLQARLTPAYRTWEARHKRDMDFIFELRFLSLKEQFKGRGDHAMGVIDHFSAVYMKNYVEGNRDQLEGECEVLIDRANPEDDDTDIIVGDYLGILRKWQERK